MPSIRNVLNSVRTAWMFRVRYPWVKHGRDVHVMTSATFWAPNKLIEIGDHVGIGFNCEFSTDVIIGSHVMIASNVAFLARDAHSPYVPGVTMYCAPRGDKFRIVVEDDVWIGSGAIILSGVVIGRGSIVAAGALVTRDVPAYSIVGAEPARVLKSRFTPEQIAIHEAALRDKYGLDTKSSAAAAASKP